MKIRFFAVLLLCCLLFGGCAHAPERAPEPLRVYAPKIGAADSFLITCGGESMLIDLGEEDDSAELLRLLKGQKITKLDTLIVTHFDKDHIGSAAEVLGAVPVGRALQAGYEKDNKRYRAYREALENNDIPVAAVAEEPVSFSLGAAKVTVYPALSAYETDNDNSLAVVIEHGQMRLLFAGDAEDARMEELMAQLPKGPYDLVKLPHHGRHHETSAAFLAFAAPDFAVITSSEKNPAETALLSLLEQGETRTFETRNGDVMIMSTGNTLTVSQRQD